MGKSPKASELEPVNWPAIEPHYRAGLRSLRDIGAEFGVSHVAIQKHADKFGWVRDLGARIRATAAAEVAKAVTAAQVTDSVTAAVTEKQIVAANAELSAQIQIGQRVLTDRAAKLVGSLMRELEQTTEAPELFGQVHALLESGEDPDPQLLTRLAESVTSLPSREKVARGLLESLHRAITLQRLTYGIDNAQKAVSDADSFENLRDMADAR